MRKPRFNFPVKIAVLLAIILLAITILIGYIWKVLRTSEFFSVKQVVVRNSEQSFDYLLGKNIFNLDLKTESRKVILNCSDCRKVRFAKIFPNTLVVDFLKRQPLALVKFYKNFAIDEQGILFNPGADLDQDGLPVIYGLETKIFAPKPGGKYKCRELVLALSILREFRAQPVFRDFVLKRIDVAQAQSAGFFVLLPKQPVNYILPGHQAQWLGFEVRLGESNIAEKMMILGGLVKQASREWPNIKYIDLRFKEPVIKLSSKI